MVLNRHCIGCHLLRHLPRTSTTMPGMEYASFDDVESEWALRLSPNGKSRSRGTAAGRKANGKIEPHQGARWKLLMRIFANPNLPEIDDYYEPFTFDYDHLQSAPGNGGRSHAAPLAA